MTREELLMHFYLGRDEPDALPDWDVYTCDAFGRLALLGGIMGMAATHDEAMSLAASFYPEYPVASLRVVRSTIVPPWPTAWDA